MHVSVSKHLAVSRPRGGSRGRAEGAMAPPPPFPLEHAPFLFCTMPLQAPDPKCLDLRTCENESTRDVQKEVPINEMRYS